MAKQSMYDFALALEIVSKMLWSTQIIRHRFEPIQSPLDFMVSDAGLEKFDAIYMQLIAIGESVKNLDKITGGSLLPELADVEWKKIMGMRDVISHHYFDVDHEAVYTVCEEHIGPLQIALEHIARQLEVQVNDGSSTD